MQTISTEGETEENLNGKSTLKPEKIRIPILIWEE